MSFPKVSVIIPTYNRIKKLISTINSIKQSDYPKNKLEIIIVDDCSTDDTEKVILNLARRYRNIKYLRTKENSGPAVARNIGVERSKGEFIFFTDDDCLVKKNWIKIYVEFFKEHKNVAGIGGPLIPLHKNLIARIEKLKDSILKIGGDKEIIGRENVNIGFTSNMAYRKKVLKKVGGFNESFKVPAGEDKELKERVCKFYDVAFLPVPVMHNQTYDLNYLLAILYKQGLNKMPPNGKGKKILGLILNFPRLLVNVLEKVISYRKWN